MSTKLTLFLIAVIQTLGEQQKILVEPTAFLAVNNDAAYSEGIRMAIVATNKGLDMNTLEVQVKPFQ